MWLIFLFSLLATSLAAPMIQSMSLKDDGSYQFFYETGKEGGSHSRTETRGPDGVVVGRYSYEDPSGELREVHYRADDSGYVAKGDVGVEGAPKSQFPAEGPVENAVAEDQGTESGQEVPDEVDENKDTDDEENFQDLPLEEDLKDGPPEAFPQGFFLEKFTGLRRLPEVTKDPPSTTQAPAPADDAEDVKKEEINQDVPVSDSALPDPTSVETFYHLRPFHGHSAQEWASAMFHQPVHIYSYQQPNAYGYHYFF